MKPAPHSGTNLREALDAARRAGCTIDVVARTGELTISHPAWPRRVRINRRRRDAPRSLTGLLMRLARDAERPA
jgi:hypothetical protein